MDRYRIALIVMMASSALALVLWGAWYVTTGGEPDSFTVSTGALGIAGWVCAAVASGASIVYSASLGQD